MDEWMLSAKLDCLMSWKFPAVQGMEVAQDAGRGHLARLSECDVWWLESWGEATSGLQVHQRGYYYTLSITSSQDKASNLDPCSSGSGAPEEWLVTRAALGRWGPKPGLTVGLDAEERSRGALRHRSVMMFNLGFQVMNQEVVFFTHQQTSPYPSWLLFWILIKALVKKKMLLNNFIW